MSIGIADQRVSYDNPCAPIVKFSQSDNLDDDDDDDDVMDEQIASSNDTLLQPGLEHSIKAFSLEDLVQSFDQTIHACFPTTTIIELDDKPTPADSIPTSNTWADLVEHLRTSLRQDLKLPHIAQSCRTALQTTDERTICLDDIQSIDDLNEDEEEELREQLDMHSVIVSSHTFLHEPFLTAEQVISEIDFMLQDMTPDSGFCDDLPELHSPHSFLGKFPLQHQSTAALNQLQDELNASIKDLSGVLVQELALRDDLEDEKESRNTFISLVVSIQNKRRHLINDKRHKRRSLFGSGSSPEAGTFPTTVIPVDGGRAGCLSSEHLQNLNQILHAINEDSPQVPELLTNYILKVLCPC